MRVYSKQLEDLKRTYHYEGLGALIVAVKHINESRGHQYQPSMVRRVIKDVQQEENE